MATSARPRDTIYLNNESNTSTDITKLDANRNGTHYIERPAVPALQARAHHRREGSGARRDLPDQLELHRRARASRCHAPAARTSCASASAHFDRRELAGRLRAARDRELQREHDRARRRDLGPRRRDLDAARRDAVQDLHVLHEPRRPGAPLRRGQRQPAAPPTRFPGVRLPHERRRQHGDLPPGPARLPAREREVLVPEELRHHADGRLPDQRPLRDLGHGQQQHRPAARAGSATSCRA